MPSGGGAGIGSADDGNSSGAGSGDNSEKAGAGGGAGVGARAAAGGDLPSGDGRLSAGGAGASPGGAGAPPDGAGAPLDGAPSPLDAFLANVPEGQRIAVLDQFLDLARNRLNLVDVEVISAAPLTPAQQHRLEIQLIRAFRKKVSIRLSVDPSLIGGLRVLANDMVFDASVKRKLSDMKASIYRGVYFK
jgi:hypothetical protein